MNTAQKAGAAGASIAGLFAALSIAAPGLVRDEGWVTVTYDDPAHGAALPTACAGVTGAKYGVKAGKRYSQAECEAMTARAMLDHALAIQHCTPAGLPTKTHAAFIRFT
ncbi:glycoside hydrolase family protein [Phenylobacterium koreense]|uniref:Lysozyme n=1 Tax=Phenylobacterium koreense TaxID=266125 RepID=A0ABV2EHD4_9CAUL